MTGCNGSNIFGQKSQVTLIPSSFENPKETRGTPSDAPADDYDLLNLPEVDTSQPQTEPTTPAVATTAQTEGPSWAQPATTASPATVKPVVVTPNPSNNSPKTAPPIVQAPTTKPDSLYDRASTFVKNAIWVMVKEGKKIGTPCNFFLRRVLEVSGFAKAPFIANDFDNYAEKYFSSFKEQTFKSVKNERDRLRQYLWSFPSSTPFIMNWHKDGVKYGHVAIVERYDNDLVIYQASIGSHSARQDKATVESLLDDDRFHRDLTVYTNFSKK